MTYVGRSLASILGVSNKRRILIVDDEPSIRMLVRTVLERAGYDVTTARDGREAIALLAASDYDLVLLDVIMPNLSGLGVVDELRKDKIGVLAHTYLMTGGDANQFIARAMAAIHPDR